MVCLTGFMKTCFQWVSKGPMLSVSLVPRLGTFPPRTMGDCLHLPLSSAIFMIIILSRGLVQLARAKPMYSPVKASTEHCSLLKGLCQNSPLPTPLVLTPRPDPPTHCQGSPWAIQPYRPRRQALYFFGHRTSSPAPGDNLQWPRFKEIRHM